MSDPTPLTLAGSGVPPCLPGADIPAQRKFFQGRRRSFGQVTIPPQDGEGEEPPWFNWRTFLVYSGPGLLMSVAYLDPGNLEADLQQGANTGFSLLWLLFLAHFTGFTLQTLAVRLGNVTGKHLAEVCAQELPRHNAWIVYLMIEGAIIAADVQGILGSSIAFNILFGIPLWVGCCMTGLSTFLLLGIEQFGVRKLEVLFAALLSVMGTCFLYDYFADAPAVPTVAAGLVPYVHRYALVPAVSTLGAVVMPHNIFLHSALVLSRDVDRSRPSCVREANKYCTIDAGVALSLCFFLNLAVVGSFAQNFFDPMCADDAQACVGTDIAQPSEGSPMLHNTCRIGGAASGALARVCTNIGLRGAGDALRHSLGRSASYIWALGLLAAGQSCTLTGTYAGQFVMEGFWRMEVPCWVRAVITRCLALVPAMAVCLLSQSHLLDNIDQWINVFQSIMLPFALLPVLMFTDSPRIMGPFKNPRALSALCWVQAGLSASANIYLACNFLFSSDGDSDDKRPILGYYVLVALFSMFYFGSLHQVVSNMLINELVHEDGTDPSSNADEAEHAKSRSTATPMLETLGANG